MLRVLFVSGDSERVDRIGTELRGRGFDLTRVATGAAAIGSRAEADVVLLNLDLPDLDGIEVCRRIRSGTVVPMIGMIAESSPLERVLALRAGLDVCLSKPCGTPEIIARINTVTRRTRARCVGGRALRYGALEIDVPAREVRLRGTAIRLTRKEFDLLHLLASRPGVTFDRRQILAEVWDDDNAWMRRSRTIDTHVNSIRRKLGGLAAISTQRGVGFRFSAT
ncbi:response regulator transcription factor [Actinokineospora diospyrosa]|uniref:Sensory transduction protein RegX3 n=1 Tax=Actinokineospora diospyrosa TaxID=103728 RepID=A0ABT1IDV5_9PSEU|nr:response regulator transcription factor [Actinokineospora diospyrosa]MCP2270810.1 DNA-binding response regulator, OmpR family, contains REC and winged-helix (wHTH) domain [Actinokineospora diospyrosa]